MRDLLAAWGHVVLDGPALALAVWTLVALAADGLLRATRAHAALALPLRSALVAAMPVALAAPMFVRWLTPAAPFAPEILTRTRAIWLPEVTVGAPGAPVEAAGPPLVATAAGTLALLAVLVGAVATVRLASAHRRLGRLTWPAAPPAVQAEAMAALSAMGVSRPVRVVTGGSVPFTFGWRRPTVAVPADLNGEPLRLALAHEAAHIRASDYGAQLALAAAAAPFAAHPLVGWLVRAAALDRERLADAAVLASRPDAGRAYGHLLVSFADRAAPRLALGAAPGGSPLLHRLAAMSRPVSPARLRALSRAGRLLALVALVGIALGGLASSAQAPAATRTFRLVHPSVTVNGHAFGEQGNRFESPTFKFLVVTLYGTGRFILWDRPFAGASKTGYVDGAQIHASASGQTLAITAAEPILQSGPRLPLYVRYDATEGLPRPPSEAQLGIGLSQDVSNLGPIDPEQRDRALAADVAAGRVVVIGGTIAPAPPDSIYDAVDEVPEIMGGTDMLLRRLIYPESARAEGVEGTTFVRFVVESRGSVSSVTVARSSGDARLDSAATRAVRMLGFRPGRLAGRAVAVRLVLPVRFALPAGDDRGALLPTGVVRYAGVDLSRLANGADIQALLDALSAPLAADGAPYGDARVDYHIQPDGRTADLRGASGPPALQAAAREVAAALVTAENARPGAPAPGFFKLWYARG